MEKAALDAIVRILAEAFLANISNRFKGIGILCPQNTALFDTAPFLFLLKPWRELFSFFCDLLPDLADDLADAGVKRICVRAPTKEPGANGDPLYLDADSAVCRSISRAASLSVLSL